MISESPDEKTYGGLCMPMVLQISILIFLVLTVKRIQVWLLQ